MWRTTFSQCFQIPSSFDVEKPSEIKGPYIDSLVDYENVAFALSRRWQCWINMHATDVELESNTWAYEILMISMDNELRTRVHDDLETVEDPRAKGAITTFKIMTSHMVFSLQEKTDALHNWIRTTTILVVDGQNVTVFVSRWKAVLRALGDANLPANTLRYLLTSFEHASNEEFVQLCTTLKTIHRSELVSTEGLTTKQKCFQT